MFAPAKASDKITNWKNYHQSLVQRGSITFWFDEDVVRQWSHPHDTRKVGRPYVFREVAITCLLTLRELFHLPYRQTEGLARSLAQRMDVELSIPDYTSLAKRVAWNASRCMGQGVQPLLPRDAMAVGGGSNRPDDRIRQLLPLFEPLVIWGTQFNRFFVNHGPSTFGFNS